MSVPIRVPQSGVPKVASSDVLHRYQVLDTPPEPQFDRITRLAARLFSAGGAQLAFIDGDRVWTKSCCGGGGRADLENLQRCALLFPGVCIRSDEAFFAGTAVCTADGEAVGVLSITDDRPRPDFDADCQAALIEIAGMVVQALEDRLSGLRLKQAAAERSRVHAELQVRLAQQAAVAHLGQRALAGVAIEQLMQEAVEVVARTLQVEFCKLLEMLPNGRRMLLRAGVGWRPGVVGSLVLSARSGSQAAYALESAEPVIVEDLSTETRFHPPRLLRVHGVVSGITVIILGPGQPFGVIGAHTARKRAFTVDDIHFLQAIANTLSVSIERRRAESALEKSEGTVRAILEAAPQGMIATDDRGRIRTFNTRAEQMFGYRREELLGRPLEVLVPERLRGGHMAQRSAFFSTPRFRPMGQGLELSALRKDGSEFPVEIGLGYVAAPEGTLAISLITDITARKKAEAELVFQASLLAQVRNAVIATDAEGTVVYWNEFARAMYGWSAAEAVGKHIADLNVPPECRQAALQILSALRETGHWEGEFLVRRKDGSRFPAFVTDSLLRDASGRVTGFVGISIDITERKQAEEALRQAKRNLDMVVQTTPLAMVSIDLEQRVRFWNPAAERMFGWSEREVLGKPVPTVPEEEASHFANLMAGYRAGCSVSGVERRRKRKDGSLIDVSIYTTPLRDATGQVDGALGVFIDVTERRRFEEQVRQSETLDSVCLLVEAQSQRALCSVLLLDETGLRLRNGGAPSLPPEYSSAIEGVPAAPEAGCFGPVDISPDIAGDPRWERFRDFALQHGLRACWSAPVFSSARRMLGVFAMYAREPGAPTPHELELLQRAARLAANVIERNSAEQALREKEEKYRTLFEESRDAIVITDRHGRVADANQAALDLFGYSAGPAVDTRQMFVNPRDRLRFLRALDPAGAVRDFDTRLRRHDGREIDCLITATVRRAKAGSVVGYRAIVRDVTAKKEAERSLLELSGRLLQMQDEERRRIARELHDSTAQSLAALAMNMSLLEIELLPDMEERPRRLLAESRALAGQCSRELRTISHLLHPPLLDELGLASALHSYVDGFASRSGIKVDLEIGPDLPRLPREAETALFRIVQESLTNVHRHSGSPTAQVRLLTNGTTVRVEVRDQGCGMPGGTLEQAGGSAFRLGVGIRGMRERIRQLGGFLRIDSGPGGTAIAATMPAAGTRAAAR